MTMHVCSIIPKISQYKAMVLAVFQPFSGDYQGANDINELYGNQVLIMHSL
jgi:hypothetical protein